MQGKPLPPAPNPPLEPRDGTFTITTILLYFIPMEKPLSQLLASLPDSAALSLTEAEGKTPVHGLCFDSRAVKEGSLFFALPGIHVHGNDYIPQAIENGAAAVVYQDSLPAAVHQRIAQRKEQGLPVPPLVQVRDARFAMSPIADRFYDSPSSKLAVIGVTGTEGKSSTVSFVWQLLRLLGKKAGFISTVEFSLGGEAISNPEHQTTPEAPIVQRQLHEMVQAGCEYAVVESSSHGLSPRTNRLGDVCFDGALWMNVTQEHLEFHGTYEQYRDDKANLFRALDRHSHEKTICGNKRTVPAFGIVNLEDPAASYFVQATTSPVIGFTSHGEAGRGKESVAANPPAVPFVEAVGIGLGSDGSGISFTMKGTVPALKDKPLAVDAPTSGAFNAYNIMAAAVAVATITELPLEQVAEQARQLKPITGRMTVVDCGQPFEVIVDYAHTPSSFQTIFPPLRQRVKGRIFVVFGSGGERDTTKRPEQGRIAARWCNVVVLADEDPRGEDPLALLEDIAAGCRAEGKKDEASGLLIIPRRQTAIRTAFGQAQKGDVVLLLGKAHENSIIYKDFVMPYDEIAEAKAALAEMGYSL